MNDIDLGIIGFDLSSWITEEKQRYIELFNTHPTTESGSSILDYYRGALSVLVTLENKLND